MSTETEDYKGYTIEIGHDDMGINPFEEWDGNVPLMYEAGRQSGKDYSNGEMISHIESFLTDNQIIRHQKKIAEIFYFDLDYFKDNDYSIEDKAQLLRDEISDFENYEQLEEFCTLAKIPHLKTSWTGYSQGDWSNIFICETPEFLAVSGCKELTEEHMESGAELWRNWAQNDVFFWSIEESGDSCSGYYGDDHEASGLLESAKDSIDNTIIEEENKVKKIRKSRLELLKQLIKAHVPLGYRHGKLLKYNI